MFKQGEIEMTNTIANPAYVALPRQGQQMNELGYTCRW
jgi:hypothetical protein